MYYIEKNGVPYVLERKDGKSPLFFRSWVMAKWWIKCQVEPAEFSYQFRLNLRKF